MPADFFNPAWFADSLQIKSMLAWRGVEAQHAVSTLRLADTLEEQALLEDLLETSKPTMPPDAFGKHFLLATPFRYSPTYESRFRPAGSRGLWYGAQTAYGVCAELARLQHRFLMESVEARDDVRITHYTLFQAAIKGRAIDLTQPPWLQSRSLWVHPTDYSATHVLAQVAQQQGTQWLRYESARAQGECCAVVFDIECLTEPKPSLDSTKQTWVCKTTKTAVTLQRDNQRFTWPF